VQNIKKIFNQESLNKGLLKLGDAVARFKKNLNALFRAKKTSGSIKN
jgi:hypothetical protein